MGRVWKSITLLSLGSSRLFTAFTPPPSLSLFVSAATMSTSSLSAGKKPWLGSHSNSVAEVYMFPMFKDNYGYLVIEPGTRRAVCIDPGEGQAVLDAVRTLDVDLVAAWCTHKHADHIGGLTQLQEAIPHLQVIASKYEEGPSHPSRTVEDCEVFSFGGGLSVKVFHTPCHTRGHILYYIHEEEEESSSNKIPLLFSGDTLFVGGCGRFFEGNAAEMLKNMDLISTLPPQTQVFCAHEYTESNYKFLAHLHPTLCNEKYEEVKAKRLAGQSTVPSTIADELSFNLFMQCHDKKVQDLLGAQNAEDAMRLLRERKNAF